MTFHIKPTDGIRRIYSSMSRKSISKALKMFIIFDLLFILELFYILIIYSNIILHTFFLTSFLSFCFLITKKKPFLFFISIRKDHISDQKQKLQQQQQHYENMYADILLIREKQKQKKTNNKRKGKKKP